MKKIIVSMAVLLGISLSLSVSGMNNKFIQINNLYSTLGECNSLAVAKGAIIRDDYNALKVVLQSGVDINKQDSNGNTFLHTAIIFGRNSIVQFLLSQGGIDVNRKNWSGDTPLGMARKLKNKDAFVPLLNHRGLNLNIKNNAQGDTLLHWAVRGRSGETVKSLLSKKSIDITVKDSNGNTALDVACLYNNTVAKKLLIEKAAEEHRQVMDSLLQEIKEEQYFNEFDEKDAYLY